VFSRLFVSTRVIALLIFPGICALAQTGEKLGFDEISQVIQTFEQLHLKIKNAGLLKNGRKSAMRAGFRYLKSSQLVN
jgi:hypothetical protein